MIKIYHNPRFSKSRETLQLLKTQGITPEIILYLETPLDIHQLQDLVNKLGFRDIRQLIRTQEPLYRELSLDQESIAQHQLLEALARHPQLLERPIVVTESAARLVRPPEQVLEIIGH